MERLEMEDTPRILVPRKAAQQTRVPPQQEQVGEGSDTFFSFSPARCILDTPPRASLQTGDPASPPKKGEASDQSSAFHTPKEKVPRTPRF